MKNLRKIVVMLVFFSILVVLTSCFDVDRATGIAVTKMPKNTYYQNEITIDDIDLEVTIYYSTTHSTYNYAQAVGKGVVFTGFDLSTIGNFTATVSFEGLSTTFNYSVVARDSKFAGGNGTALNPYLISTPEQFMQMDDEMAIDRNVKLYFKLINDIDFNNITVTPFYDNLEGEYSAFGVFNGSLDGDNYKLSNIHKFTIANPVMMFGTTPANLNYESEIKNLVYENNIPLALVGYARSSFKFDNVDVKGTITVDMGNFSQYFVQALDGANITFENCTNYLNYYGNSIYGALFLGGYSSKGSTITFRNCVNYGSIEAQNAGIFIGNYGTVVRNNATVIVENCENHGKATGINSGLFVGEFTDIVKEYPGITNNTNLFTDLPKVDVLKWSSSGAYGEDLVIDLAGVADMDSVKYVRVSMQYRTYQTVTNYTGRHFEIREAELTKPIFNTGFKNWTVREPSKIDATYQDPDYVIDGVTILTDPVIGFKYIVKDSKNYYYYNDDLNYLKTDEPEAFYFVAFLLDEEGKILYVTNKISLRVEK